MAHVGSKGQVWPALVPVAGRRLLVRLIAIGFAQAVATGAIALIADRLFTAAAEAQQVPAAGIAVVAALASAVTVLRYRERVDGERLGQAVAHHVRQALSEHLVKLPATIGRQSPGGVLLRFVGDLAALRTWYARGVVTLCVTVPMTAAGIAAIAWLEWRVALTLAVALGAAAVGQAWMARGLREAAREARRRRGRLASDVVERVDALATVQAFGQAGTEARRMARRSNALAEAMIARARWSGLLRGSAEWLAAGLPVLILLVWSGTGGVSLGAAAATLTVGALLAVRMHELGRVLEYLTLARISQERIAAFLSREVLDQRGTSRPTRRREGRLKLRRLRLKGEFPELNFAAEPGTRVALTGANGAGKSRLLAVIAGLEEPAAGRVVIDGQDVTRRRLSSLRRLVALASAEAPMLRGTVDSNIRYGARADETEARAILELVGYEALIAELRDGGATRVGPSGRGLSLGQERRVILMRALMRRPLVLLLDEIEAGLDAAGQEMLARVFEAFEGTIVMATHDADWIGRCDTRWSLSSPTAMCNARCEAQHG